MYTYSALVGGQEKARKKGDAKPATHASRTARHRFPCSCQTRYFLHVLTNKTELAELPLCSILYVKACLLREPLFEIVGSQASCPFLDTRLNGSRDGLRNGRTALSRSSSPPPPWLSNKAAIRSHYLQMVKWTGHI